MLYRATIYKFKKGLKNYAYFFGVFFLFTLFFICVGFFLQNGETSHIHVNWTFLLIFSSFVIAFAYRPIQFKLMNQVGLTRRNDWLSDTLASIFAIFLVTVSVWLLEPLINGVTIGSVMIETDINLKTFTWQVLAYYAGLSYVFCLILHHVGAIFGFIIHRFGYKMILILGIILFVSQIVIKMIVIALSQADPLMAKEIVTFVFNEIAYLLSGIFSWKLLLGLITSLFISVLIHYFVTKYYAAKVA